MMNGKPEGEQREAKRPFHAAAHSAIPFMLHRVGDHFVIGGNIMKFMMLAILVVLLSWVPVRSQPQSGNKSVSVGTASEALASLAERPYRKLHALCIGINDYQYTGIPDLRYAEPDAQAVANVLRDHYGFDTVVTLLGPKATKDQIVDALSDLMDGARVAKEDGVLIYFSGHGQTVRAFEKETGYLLPVDAQVNLDDVKNARDYRRYAISMEQLRNDADQIPARHVLFIVDACYSGYLSTKSLDAPPDVQAGLRYPVRQVITAGTEGEQAVEFPQIGHGLFTSILLRRLQGETQPVSGQELGVFVSREVPRELSVRAPERRLTPQSNRLWGNGDFYLIPKSFQFGKKTEAAPILTPAAPAATPVPMEYFRKVWEAEQLLKELEETGATQ